MLEVLISILFVYGFVLIAVRGTIFTKPRTAFFSLVDKSEKWFEPTLDTVTELLAEDSYEISPEINQTHEKIKNKLESSPEKIEEITKLVNDLKLKALSQIKNKRNKNIVKKISLFILQFIRNLWQCPMCLGFWVGLIFSLLTALVNITIFGITLSLITFTGPACIFGLFILACIFSGSTWAIDQIIEWFSETKDRISWK